MVAAFLGPDTMLGRALFAPGGALTDQAVWNSRAMRAAEVPAANGVGDARSLARMYAACVGEVDGVRLLSTEQVKRATTQLTNGPNKVLMDMDIQFGLGFMVPSSLMTLGGPNSFGHFGAGGSVGWADPDAELGFGYIMNRMDMGLAGDLRSYNLINACYETIA
jgi:CubicO group peptidase (beta-lactamase class C family)